MNARAILKHCMQTADEGRLQEEREALRAIDALMMDLITLLAKTQPDEDDPNSLDCLARGRALGYSLEAPRD